MLLVVDLPCPPPLLASVVVEDGAGVRMDVAVDEDSVGFPGEPPLLPLLPLLPLPPLALRVGAIRDVVRLLLAANEDDEDDVVVAGRPNGDGNEITMP